MSRFLLDLRRAQHANDAAAPERVSQISFAGLHVSTIFANLGSVADMGGPLALGGPEDSEDDEPEARDGESGVTTSRATDEVERC